MWCPEERLEADDVRGNQHLSHRQPCDSALSVEGFKQCRTELPLLEARIDKPLACERIRGLGLAFAWRRHCTSKPSWSKARMNAWTSGMKGWVPP